MTLATLARARVLLLSTLHAATAEHICHIHKNLVGVKGQTDFMGLMGREVPKYGALCKSLAVTPAHQVLITYRACL